MSSTIPHLARRSHHHSIAYNLLMLALVAAGLGLLLAYVIDGLERVHPAGEPRSDTRLRTEINVAGQPLQPPAVWLRTADRQSEGFVDRLDMVLPVTFAQGGKTAKFDVTLISATRVRASAQLLDTVYLHRFGADQVSGPVGLVGKPLTPGDGFDGEVVWYDPLSANPFVAKCAPPVVAGAAARCVRILLLGNQLAAIVDFDRNLLGNWRDMDAALAAPFSEIGVAPAN